MSTAQETMLKTAWLFNNKDMADLHLVLVADKADEPWDGKRRRLDENAASTSAYLQPLLLTGNSTFHPEEPSGTFTLLLCN